MGKNIIKYIETYKVRHLLSFNGFADQYHRKEDETEEKRTGELEFKIYPDHSITNYVYGVNKITIYNYETDDRKAGVTNQIDRSSEYYDFLSFSHGDDIKKLPKCKGIIFDNITEHGVDIGQLQGGLLSFEAWNSKIDLSNQCKLIYLKLGGYSEFTGSPCSLKHLDVTMLKNKLNLKNFPLLENLSITSQTKIIGLSRKNLPHLKNITVINVNHRELAASNALADRMFRHPTIRITKKDFASFSRVKLPSWIRQEVEAKKLNLIELSFAGISKKRMLPFRKYKVSR